MRFLRLFILGRPICFLKPFYLSFTQSLPILCCLHILFLFICLTAYLDFFLFHSKRAFDEQTRNGASCIHRICHDEHTFSFCMGNSHLSSFFTSLSSDSPASEAGFIVLLLRCMLRPNYSALQQMRTPLQEELLFHALR